MALFFVMIHPGMLFWQQCRTGLYNVRAQRPRECFSVMLRIWLQAHGVLMAVSFVAILPISAIFAATRDRLLGPRVWFQTHKSLGVRHLPFSHGPMLPFADECPPARAVTCTSFITVVEFCDILSC